MQSKALDMFTIRKCWSVLFLNLLFRYVSHLGPGISIVYTLCLLFLVILLTYRAWFPGLLLPVVYVGLRKLPGNITVVTESPWTYSC